MNRAALVASAILASAMILPACPAPKSPPKDTASLVGAAKTRAGARGILLAFSQTADALATTCVAASHVVEATSGAKAAYDLVERCETGALLIKKAVLPAAAAVDALDDNTSPLNIVACVGERITSQNGLIANVIQLVTPNPPSILIDGLNVAHAVSEYATNCPMDGGL